MPRRRPKDPVRRDRRHQRFSDRVEALYDEVCHLCDKRGADTIDHVVAVAWGGSDHPCNLRPAHRSCNSSKGAGVPEMWTYAHPLMWLDGYGANVTGTVKVPRGRLAGVLAILFAALAGWVCWKIGQASGSAVVQAAGVLAAAVPWVYDVVVVWVWRRRRARYTAWAREDDEIVDPDAWLADALARKG